MSARLMSARTLARLAVAGLVVMLAAACSGVPQNSRPQVVRAIDGGQAQQATAAVGPTPGEDPRSIVYGFLAEAKLSTSGARQFLTLDAQSKWQPNPVVIVDDFTVGNAAAQPPGASEVVATPGFKVGTLDASGVYTPTLVADSAAAPYTFTLKKDSNGQWRIDSLPPGVLITQSDFGLDYHRQQLYFLDSTERSLIPDQRYSSLPPGQQLLTWLMKQLLAGPRPALAASVVNEVPPQVDAAHITVTSGDPIQVEMPGVDQTDSGGKLRLAEQLAFTLGTQAINGSVSLVDTGRPVAIPTVSGSSFSSADFPSVDPVNTDGAASQFYVRGGQLIDAGSAGPAASPLGDPNLALTSVAVQGVDPGPLAVVAVAGPTAGRQRVLLGKTGVPYTVVTGLPAGRLSRPEWQPRSSSAWIGVGSSAAIYQISQTGQAKAVSVTPSGGAAPTGPITDLRFSPDGSRLAAVVSGGPGADSVWVGSVVRSGANVSIGSFEPITASDLQVSDVAWRDNVVLYLIGRQPSSPERGASVWSVSSDGSNLVSLPSTNLPGPPTAIAAGQDAPPIVVSDNTLWVLLSPSWTPLGGATAPVGDSPVYSH